MGIIRVQEGLWSSAEDSIEFYQRIYNKITPYVKEYVSPEITTGIATVPSATVMIGCTRGVWNKGVKTSFKFLSELPTHMSNGIDSLMSLPAIKGSVESIKGGDQGPAQAKSP
ncbi:MICOS complex subunit MIC13 homolog QIL1 isoform X2 [Diachasma alloeum]|uniref:MICOS complex subunit MIC13 homolog QIL1 isoform X2 n=1 Tax=Diachasma alloeum TaxID=454923 RepID=UPI00073810B4|nr:MICOS complex subunit MIC13 homolog QIL1 isoform X2 [Diachasma alloeum]